MAENQSLKKGVVAGLLLGIILSGAAAAQPVVTDEALLEVRVLLDNSGSMYPGYVPAGNPGTRKSHSGAKFYYEYPEFQGWLADFVACQEILGGQFISAKAFTTKGSFRDSDLQVVQPRARLAEFDPARMAAALHQLGYGQHTYLTESLEHFTRGFDGLVWLITDNVVETSRGTPDQEVVRFFKALRDENTYQSVHLFKLPFTDQRARQSGALAIYGIRVAPRPLAREVLARFDMKMRSQFLPASRRAGNPPGDLFPGHEHRKLKDLSIDALELTPPPLQVEWIESRNPVANEDRKVLVELHGEIHSHLTQHSVTQGEYTLTPVSAFVPEAWAARELGVEPIAPQSFSVVSTPLRFAIPPNGVQAIKESIPSRADVHISTHGLWAWLRMAFKGAIVDYSGTAEISFSKLKIDLERSRMAGIFGIDKASPIFDIQDVQKLDIPTTRATIHLALRTSSRRSVLLGLLLLVLGLPLAVALWLLSRRETYRIRVSDQTSIVALHRLQRHDIFFQGHRLGTLSRNLAGHPVFSPHQESVGVTVEPARSSAAYDVRLRDGGSYQLTIEPLNGTESAAMGRPGGRPPGSGGLATRRPELLPRAVGAGEEPTAKPNERPAVSPRPGPGPKIRRP